MMQDDRGNNNEDGSDGDDDVSVSSSDDESRSSRREEFDGWSWEDLASRSEEDMDDGVQWTRLQTARWKLARLIKRSATKGREEEEEDDTAHQIANTFESYWSCVHIWEHDSNGILALHFAVMIGATLSAIKVLAEAHPRGIILGYRRSDYDHSRFLVSYERSAILIPSANPSVKHYLTYRAVRYLSAVPKTCFDRYVPAFFMAHLGQKDVIGPLLDEFTDFARRRASFTNRGLVKEMDLPLHSAVRAGAPIQVLDKLVSIYPQALMEEDIDGRLPLHLAACGRSDNTPQDPDVFRLLASPAAIRARDQLGMLPLHIVCGEKLHIRELEVIQLLVESYPESCRKLSSDGHVPFHLACNDALPEELPLIQYMVDKCPESIDVVNGAGESPLNVACRSYMDSDSEDLTVVRFLAETFPNSVCSRGRNGRTQLQLACQYSYRSNADLIKCLVEACPQAMKELDYCDRTPLHNLCESARAADLPSIQFMADRFPELLKAKNHSGETPLHSAVKGRFADDEVIRLLVQMCPEVLESDSDVGSPLHTLCKEQKVPRCNIRSRFEMLAISAKAVTAKNGRGKNPYHLLVEGGAPTYLLEILERASPNVIYARDAQGRTPLHLAVAGFALAEQTWRPDIDYDPEYAEGYFYDPIFTRAMRGFHDEAVAHLLKAFPAGVNVLDKNKVTPLIGACEADAGVDLIYQLICVDPVANLGLAR